ncbi:MAG: hypothetical protein JNM23_06500 [Bradyrhizobiaceae bacterium]|nr:hypothetical protein [Bradyrhizobiaceae bacterium]
MIASARLASRNREAVILLFCADGKAVEGINETAAGVMLCAGVAEAARLALPRDVLRRERERRGCGGKRRGEIMRCFAP